MLKFWKVKQNINTLEVEKSALKMEKTAQNEKRLKELEKELTNLKEKQRKLKIQFENEKETFNASSKIKSQIEELKNIANIAKRDSQFEKAAKIEYSDIPNLENKLKQNEQKWSNMEQTGTLLKNFVDEDAIAKIVSKFHLPASGID